LQREINTLRINKEGKSFFSRENQLFRNNGLLGGATIDFFAADRQKFGDARIDTALADTIIALQLEGKQAEVFQTMQHILGCILCVAGPGSVSKSRIFVALSVYCYLVDVENRTAKHGGNVWIVAPINAQLNDLTPRIHAVLLRLYNEVAAQGKQWRCPLVVSHHARAADDIIYEEGANAARAAEGIDTDVYELDDVHYGHDKQSNNDEQSNFDEETDLLDMLVCELSIRALYNTCLQRLAGYAYHL
jgi:hypothetical protein